jgi:hypothetical protein
MAKCSSCGADIMWGVTTNGKPVPLNTKPKMVYVILNADKNIYSLETGYESHFSDCPDAAKFRKKPGETAPSDLPPLNISEEIEETEYNDGGDKNN